MGTCDSDPIDFTWNKKCVVRQSMVSFTPKTIYRYEAGDGSLSTKQTANGEVSYADAMKKIPAGKSYSIKLCFISGIPKCFSGWDSMRTGS